MGARGAREAEAASAARDRFPAALEEAAVFPFCIAGFFGGGGRCTGAEADAEVPAAEAAAAGRVGRAGRLADSLRLASSSVLVRLRFGARALALSSASAGWTIASWLEWCAEIDE